MEQSDVTDILGVPLSPRIRKILRAKTPDSTTLGPEIPLSDRILWLANYGRFDLGSIEMQLGYPLGTPEKEEELYRTLDLLEEEGKLVWWPRSEEFDGPKVQTRDVPYDCRIYAQKRWRSYREERLFRRRIEALEAGQYPESP